MAQGWSDGSAAETGLRIRRLRSQRGLSLSELARRAGIGKATLSGLETGTRNPTAGTLYAIAGQLGVPLAALLTTPGAAPPAVPDLHGDAITATLLEAFTDGGVSTELYRLRIRPGPAQTSPAHGPGVVEYLTVFSGTALVGPVGAPVVVRAGEHASWLAEGPHTYAALDESVVEAGLLIRHPLAE
ncbi:helix-turn-helix transcriptional regulator [Streptacidiphilus sp. PB12-B1b]|uniref:helix-turn-helix domain-containing protein n=1 Tax=Streptacidiphilus sp. PB12-B1b TaxID=2705012 RepID=UPI0015FC3894|nr:helix-turn-helix transcriptional regulator [Streptacidiphilus sp. PB12-B1b]QMU78778.1 helix-turn-helix transcriptional regulator [Streptacidiphilus sp. PB12-B1b]